MRLTISAKLFTGFLIVIFVNVFYVVVVSKLADLKMIVNTLKHMNEAKNALLKTENLQGDRRTDFLVFDKERRAVWAEKSADRGRRAAILVDSVIGHLSDAWRLDTTVSQDQIRLVERKELLGRVNGFAYTLQSLSAAYDKNFGQFVLVSQGAPGPPREAREGELRSEITRIADSLDHILLLIRNELDGQSTLRIKEVGGRIDNAIRLTLMVLAGISLFALIFGFVFSRAITNSLRKLRESAQALAKGSFDFNPRGYPADEIGELARAFYDMAQDLKTAQDQLVKSKRLAAIGEVVASVNHEINNPLMIISGNAQFLEMSLETAPAELRERLHAIIEETDRISRVTRKLREIRNPVVEDYTSRGEQMINLDKSAQ